MNKAKKTSNTLLVSEKTISFFFFRESSLIKEENTEAIKEPYLMIHMKKMTKHIQINNNNKKVKNQKLRKNWCGGYVCIITERLVAIRTFTHS